MRHRRRLLLLAVGVAAVALVCLRPFGGDSDSGSAPDPGPAPAPAPGPGPGAWPSPSAPSAPASPAAPEDPHDHEDAAEGLVTGVEALDPAAVPGAIQAAEQFARGLSTPDQNWPDGVVELATPALAASLTEQVEREITGPGFVLLDAPEWARVGVPTDRGTIVLDVAMVEGRWLVSALAWWPEGTP